MNNHGKYQCNKNRTGPQSNHDRLVHGLVQTKNLQHLKPQKTQNCEQQFVSGCLERRNSRRRRKKENENKKNEITRLVSPLQIRSFSTFFSVLGLGLLFSLLPSSHSSSVRVRALLRSGFLSGWAAVEFDERIHRELGLLLKEPFYIKTLLFIKTISLSNTLLQFNKNQVKKKT